MKTKGAKIMARFYFTLLLLGALVAVGCGRSKTYSGPNGEKVTVSKDGGSVEVNATGEDGSKIQFSSSEKGVALPGDFPKDVPVYPGATVMSSVNSKDGVMLTLQTTDAAEKVDAFYVKNLKDQGWNSETSMKTPQGTNYGNKKEKRSLNVSINGGDKTMIMLILEQEK
jgi:hypothetical protein